MHVFFLSLCFLGMNSAEVIPKATELKGITMTRISLQQGVAEELDEIMRLWRLKSAKDNITFSVISCHAGHCQAILLYQSCSLVLLDALLEKPSLISAQALPQHCKDDDAVYLFELLGKCISKISFLSDT